MTVRPKARPGVSMRVHPFTLDKIDLIAEAKQWTRSYTIQRVLDAGLAAPEFLSVLEAQGGEAEPPPPSPEEIAAAAKERRRVARIKQRKDWRAHDPEGVTAVLHRPIEGSKLQIRYGAPMHRGWAPDQMIQLKQGISPWEPEWTAEPAEIGVYDHVAAALGLDRRNLPTDLESYIEAWRRACEANGGVDPITQ